MGGKGGSSATGGAAGSSSSTGGSPGTGGSTMPSAATVVTSANNAWWTTGTLTVATSGTANVTVNDSGTKQNWEGMGGAFNEIGWQKLMAASSSDQTTAMNLLFGTDGAHFQMGRIPIGASDYATTRYTDEETQGTFTIAQDMKFLIPYVKAAQAVNPDIRFWASPWTPPTWMKTTSGSVNSTSCALVGKTMFDGGCMNASTSNLMAYAQYFASWVSAYKDQGITIDTVAPQNEPNYAEGYPSCLWNSADLAKFVGQYLGPALMSSGTKIMTGTNSNGDSGKDTTVVSAIQGDSTAKTFTKMIGLQWSMLDNFEKSPSSFTTYGIPVWATEHKCGNYPWMTSAGGANSCGFISCPAYVSNTAPNDMSYGVESWGYIEMAIAGGVTSYNAWNMILDGGGAGNDTSRAWSQDGLLTVSPSSCKGKTMGAICATPAYYAFRHVSAFAPAGGTVLSTDKTVGISSLGSSTASSVTAVAFKNKDGSEVAVVYNGGSAVSGFIVAIAGKKYQFSMPAQGWATVYVPAGA
jgi:glucosylceramidase